MHGPAGMARGRPKTPPCRPDVPFPAPSAPPGTPHKRGVAVLHCPCCPAVGKCWLNGAPEADKNRRMTTNANISGPPSPWPPNRPERRARPEAAPDAAGKAAAVTRSGQPLLWETPERNSRNHVRRASSECRNKDRTKRRRTQAAQALNPRNAQDRPQQGKSALPARSPWARFRAASPPGPATQGPLPSLTCLREAWPQDAVANAPSCGEVPEWLNGTVSKTVVLARVPWVRIPPSPPEFLTKSLKIISFLLSQTNQPPIQPTTGHLLGGHHLAAV